MRQRILPILVFLAAVIVVLVIMFNLGVFTSQARIEREISAQTSDYMITATLLGDHFVASPKSVEKQYKDKIITVIGMVDYVGKDFIGVPFVSLYFRQINPERIVCYFSSTHQPELNGLINGQEVKIKGRFGEIDENISLLGCSFVE